MFSFSVDAKFIYSGFYSACWCRTLLKPWWNEDESWQSERLHMKFCGNRICCACMKLRSLWKSIKVILLTFQPYLATDDAQPEEAGRGLPQTSGRGDLIVEYTEQLGVWPEHFSIFRVCETLFHHHHAFYDNLKATDLVYFMPQMKASRGWYGGGIRTLPPFRPPPWLRLWEEDKHNYMI